MTDSQAPEALLPCPFCGGEGEMSYYALAKNPAPAGHFIECTTCAASGEYAKIQGEMPDRVEFAQARAIAAWNRRATSPIPPAPSDVAGVVAELLTLSALEPGWYANVGKKTGERCCAAMSKAAALIESLSHDREVMREALMEACDAADEILVRVTAEVGRYVIEATDEDMVPMLVETGVVLTAKMFRRLYQATDRAALASLKGGEK